MIFKQHILFLFQYEFFEVSYVSFVRGLGASLKEGCLIKQSDEVHHVHSLFLRLTSTIDSSIFHRAQKYALIFFRITNILLIY